MTECPPERRAGFPWLKEEPVEDFASRHAQLSVRGKRVLDRLLVLLPPHLKPQPTSRVSPFPPALLFSICDAFHLDFTDSSTEQSDLSVLPSVLNKLREWRLLDANHRYSPGGIHKLALDLAGIIDEPCGSTGSDLDRTSHARLRMKWVSSDSPSETQDRESSPSSSASRLGVLDSAPECAHALPGLTKRRSDTGHASCQIGRLGTPDSEDASAVVSPRQHSASGFRSGCSACRHLRLSGSSHSPRVTPVPFSPINQLDVNTTPRVPTTPRHPKPTALRTPTKKAKRVKNKPSQSTSRGAHTDENEPPLPKPTGVKQGICISFPRQRAHSPRISNALLSRDPISPTTTSVQRPVDPVHHSSPARQGDKRTFSRRVASVDLRLSIGPSLTRASPNDLHPLSPMRAQSFSYTPAGLHGLGPTGACVPKPSLNAAGSRSGPPRQLPSWNETCLVDHATATTCSATLSASSSPPTPVKTRFANPGPLLPLGARSRPSSTSIPQGPSGDMKRRDRRVVSHKHTSSVDVLRLSPASPEMHTRQ